MQSGVLPYRHVEQRCLYEFDVIDAYVAGVAAALLRQKLPAKPLRRAVRLLSRELRPASKPVEVPTT